MAKGATPEVKQLIQECMSHPGTGDAFVEQSRQQLRQRCKDDPWFFIYWVLGYKDIDNDLHHDMTQRWIKRRHRLFSLWQVPRGHLKTSVWTIGMSMWELLLDPNIRILIINAVYSNAQDMMSEIAQHIKTNEIFRWMWPDYCPDLQHSRRAKMCKVTADRIDLPCGNRMGRREGNLECLGVEMSLVSKHYDLFMFDDLVNDVNTATTEYRNKVWKWFLNSWQLRHSPIESRIRDIGTPWHLDDTHARIIKQEAARRKKGKPAKWLIYRRAATEETPYSDKKEPIWAERFTLPILDDLKDELGTYIYSCQYDCNPISPENALFQECFIKSIEEDDIPENVVNFAAVDLSEEGDDYTVVVVASFDTDGQMFVRQVIRGHIRPLELIDTIRSLDDIWKLERIGIETVGFQKTIYKFYKDYAHERGFYLPFKEMKRGNTHKMRRFLALQPLVERGYFYVTDDIANRQELINEMTTVSFDHLPSHDDILDCLADLQQLSYGAPPEIEEDVAPSGSMDALHGSLDDLYNETKEYVIGRSFWRAG